MTEVFLQYLWQHQLLEGALATTDGQTIVVERAGDLNRDAGPDFVNSRLVIGGVKWAGNVEVHVKASDWKLHGHTTDKAYGNVILHVVYEHDFDVVTENDSVLPTLELKPFVPEVFWRNYQALVSSANTNEIPCGGRLNGIPDFVFGAYLDRLVVERIERKTDTVRRLLSESNGNWEQCCYWMMAHYFGGKVNGFTFELLAKATDMRYLARWKDNPKRLEALLMGQAGLLDGLFNDDYPRELQADYEAIQKGTGLQPIAGYLWRSFRLRPSSFPAIRISQFARFVSQSSHIFATMQECKDVKQLEAMFDVEAADYWHDHYQFDQPSKPSTRHLGRIQVGLIIINACIPLLFHYGVATGQQQYKDQALMLLAQLPPEDNRIIRTWAACGRHPLNALQSQAMLELSNEYCENRRCLACQIGYRLIKNKLYEG